MATVPLKFPFGGKQALSDLMAFADERQFIVKVNILTGLWAVASGGKLTWPDAPAWDGGQLLPVKVFGNPSIADLTLTRNYLPGRDQYMIDQLRSVLTRGASWDPSVAGPTALRCTVTQQPTAVNLAPLTAVQGGTGDVWQGFITGFDTAMANASKGSSASPATVSVTISVYGIANGTT